MFQPRSVVGGDVDVGACVPLLVLHIGLVSTVTDHIFFRVVW